jgi:hypothetical protein
MRKPQTFMAVLTGLVLAAAIAPAVVCGAVAGPLALDEAQMAPALDEERSTATTVWFQGFLADEATGDPINASYNIVARIYNAAGGGTLLWGPETHASVVITEGWFNIELGSIVSPLPTFASPPYYLSLQVNGEYLTPRLKLASVPSALQSAKSDLVPFSATYGGASHGFSLTHTGTGVGNGLRVQRSGGGSGGFGIYAENSGPAASLRAIQSYNAAAPYTSALLADVAAMNNTAPVIDALSLGAGPAFLGETEGPYALELYTDADAVADDVDAHVIHAIYDGGGRTGDNAAVYGEALDDSWGAGGLFVGSGHGVVGVSEAPPSGVFLYRGVVGSAMSTTTGQNVGVWGEADGGSVNYAGYFSGDVDVDGTLTKNAGSFKIDHPLDPANKYLYHSFVESPDMMNVYNGNVVLDAAGDAWVELPEWFEALNRDFRYQLTCIGAFAPVYVAEGVSGNRFRIAGGEPGLTVSWQVTGIRHDPYAEAHRIPVEEEKSGRERGRYRNPELYGAPETAGVLYELEERRERSAAMPHGRRAAGNADGARAETGSR